MVALFHPKMNKSLKSPARRERQQPGARRRGGSSNACFQPSDGYHVGGYKSRPCLRHLQPRPRISSMKRLFLEDKLLETVEQIRQRIKERFPDSGLSVVAAEIVLIAQ